MSRQRDVFEILEDMGKRIAAEHGEPARLQLQEVELGDVYPCSSCGRYSFPEPSMCYWCRQEGP